MDDIDVALLRAVQEDGRQTLAALSARVGLSEAPIQRRLRALEADGVIKEYVALLDGALVHLDFVVFVHVLLGTETPAAVREFERRVMQLDEVMECHRTSGEFDYLLKVVTGDARAFTDLYSDHLLRLPGVSRLEQTVSLHRVGQTTRLPLKSGTGRPRRGRRHRTSDTS